MARTHLWSIRGFAVTAALLIGTSPEQTSAGPPQVGGVGFQGGFYGPYQPGFDPGVDPGYWRYPSGTYGYQGLSNLNVGASTAPFARNRTGYFNVVPPRPTDDKTAHITVLVPEPSAEVFFAGKNTQTTGTERRFQSPELNPGTYSYDVKAVWLANGKMVTRDYSVKVRPGAKSLVDFTRR